MNGLQAAVTVLEGSGEVCYLYSTNYLQCVVRCTLVRWLPSGKWSLIGPAIREQSRVLGAAPTPARPPQPSYLLQHTSTTLINTLHTLTYRYTIMGVYGEGRNPHRPPPCRLPLEGRTLLVAAKCVRAASHLKPSSRLNTFNTKDMCTVII